MKRVRDAAVVMPSAGLDLAKLHHSLFSLERELASLTSAGQTIYTATVVSAPGCATSRPPTPWQRPLRDGKTNFRLTIYGKT